MRKLVVAALLAAGCIGSGTETGNPSLTTLGLAAYSSSVQSVALGESESGTIALSEVWVSIEEVDLVRSIDGVCDDDRPGAEVELDGIVKDLAEGPFVRDDLNIAVEEFCRIEVELGRPERDAGPPLGDRRSIFIRGTTAGGTPFELWTDEEAEFELRANGGNFQLAEIDGSLLVAFDVAGWFDGLDLDAGVPDGDGVIRIHDDTEHDVNDDLLDAFEERIEGSLEAWDDSDDDGEIDDDDERF